MLQRCFARSAGRTVSGPRCLETPSFTRALHSSSVLLADDTGRPASSEDVSITQRSRNQRAANDLMSKSCTEFDSSSHLLTAIDLSSASTPRNPPQRSSDASGRPRELVRRGPPRANNRDPNVRGPRRGPGQLARQAGPGGATPGRFNRRDRAAGPPKRKRRAASAEDDGEHDEANGLDEDGIPVGDFDEYTPDQVLENHSELFIHDAEQPAFEKIMRVVEETNALAVRAERLLQDGKKANSEETIAKAQALQKLTQADIAWGLRHLQRMYAEMMPRHRPQDFNMIKHVKTTTLANKLGGVAAGSDAGGNVVEDALRYLSRRQENTFQHRDRVKERLQGGDFVKLRDIFDKRLFVRDPDGKRVPFKVLPKDSRRSVVSRLVKGYYADPLDKAYQNSSLANVARLSGGEYDRRSKTLLMDTIKNLLPQAQRN